RAQRVEAGDRFDTTNSCRDTALGDDGEETDVASRADVRAAAQLDAEARNRHDANLVAVLLAEERHRASRDRLLRVLHVRLYGRVPQNLRVDDGLDFELLFASHRTHVHEVEAQTVWRNERPGLLYVLPEHLSKRRMKQVSGGVVAAGCIADVDRDAGGS